MQGGEGGREDEVRVMREVENGEPVVEEEGGQVPQEVVGEVELLEEGEGRQTIQCSQATAG